MNIEANVEDKVLKPVNEVFAAIVDPEVMSQYFTTGSSGPMKAGTTVVWEFADVGYKAPVDVLEVQKNHKIVYEHSSTGTKTRVTINLKSVDSNTTLVSINEAGWPMDEDGVKRALGQTAGWTYFLCCLKAYMQFGINLRLGLTNRLTKQ